jgi:hypothetical protein
MTRNKRSFISAQAVVAKKYDVIVPTGQLADAKKAMKAGTETATKKPATKKPASKS